MSVYDLQLRKGGILVTKDWNPEVENYVEREIQTDDIVFYLNDSICLDKNISLKDFFLFLERDVQYFSIVTSCPVLPDLVTEGLAEVQIEESIEEIAFLELKKIAFLQEDEEGGDKYLFSHTEFSGVNNELRYGIEFLPANVIATFPLFINEAVEVLDYDSPEDDRKLLFKYLEKFTLFGLLNGIVNELAYIGGTEQKSLMMEKIKDSLEQIDKGEVSYSNYDEFKERMQVNLEKGKIACKTCGEDTRTQHFNKPDDICFKCLKKSKEN